MLRHLWDEFSLPAMTGSIEKGRLSTFIKRKGRSSPFYKHEMGASSRQPQQRDKRRTAAFRLATLPTNCAFFRQKPRRVFSPRPDSSTPGLSVLRICWNQRYGAKGAPPHTQPNNLSTPSAGRPLSPVGSTPSLEGAWLLDLHIKPASRHF
jgi:hypothetical protein